MEVNYPKQIHTDISILIPVCSEASRKAHKIAIEEAKKYPDRFQEIYLVVYNHEFTNIYTNLIKQFE
jgi:hypothetical protein